MNREARAVLAEGQVMGHQQVEMLQAGLDLLDEGITVFDRDLRLVAWNETFLRLLDFPASMAYVGASFDSFIRYNAARGEYGPGDPESLVRERVEAARCFVSHVSERTRPNGTILLVRGEPLPHKGFVTLYGDITHRRSIESLTQSKNAELEEKVRRRTAQLESANARLTRANEEKTDIAAALRRSEERLRLINDTIPTLIGYFDKDEIYQYANKGYVDRFRAAGPITGRAVRDVVGEHVYAQVGAHLRHALNGHQVTYEYSMPIDGQTTYARSTLVPEKGPHGETLGCFVFAYEITEQKRMQTVLLQAQKMEAIGQLTGGLAHDFNNLLTVVIGNLAALQDHRPDDADLNGFVEPALQSARRGVQLIRRLLTFSRQQPLEPQAVDVGRLIGDMIALIRRSLPESITLGTDLPETPVYVVADPGQLESALLNFVLNSRDAMPEGGALDISIRSGERDAVAAGASLPAGCYVVIDVCDTGCGMDAATLGRIFEPFFTTKRLGLGSGLGLSMTHSFVQQSGGDIHIRSEPGAGTTVSMILPAGFPEDDDDPLVEDVPMAHGRELVLLVEDDPDVRRIVRLQLLDLGHPVIEAEDGAQAMALVEHVPDIAILVTDVVMPGGMNGLQLAHQIAEHHRDLRVILMSGYAEGVAEAELGRWPLLFKPFDQQDLARALRSAAGDEP